jgi:tetratricopeptide (TPR) repeat protein
MGEYIKVTDLASKVIALLEKSQRQADFFGKPFNVYSGLLAEQATCSWRMGLFEEGETLFEKAFDFALNMNYLFSLGLLELNRGWEFALKGDANAAIEHLQDSIRYCEEGQIENILVATWIGLGWAHWLLGDLKNARKYMDRGLKAQIDVGVEYDSGLFYSFAALVDLDCGDQKKAQQRAEKALKIAETNHQHGEGLVWIALGRILGKANPPQLDRAEEAFLRGINILEKLKIIAYCVPSYYFFGEFYHDTGQKEKALATLEKAQRIYKEMEMEFWLLKTKELLKSRRTEP